MKEKLIFRKLTGELIEDVNQYVKDWVAKNPHGQIIVGCDSQEYSRFVKYAIAIVMHYKDKYGAGHGAHVIKSIVMDRTHKTPKKAMRFKNGGKSFDTSLLQSKLWREVELTVQAAELLSDCEKKITIHVDYNSKPGEVSNVLYAPGLGYAQGLGYEAYGKPHAWCASAVADALCR